MVDGAYEIKTNTFLLIEIVHNFINACSKQKVNFYLDISFQVMKPIGHKIKGNKKEEEEGEPPLFNWETHKSLKDRWWWRQPHLRIKRIRRRTWGLTLCTLLFLILLLLVLQAGQTTNQPFNSTLVYNGSTSSSCCWSCCFSIHWFIPLCIALIIIMKHNSLVQILSHQTNLLRILLFLLTFSICLLATTLLQPQLVVLDVWSIDGKQRTYRN